MKLSKERLDAIDQFVSLSLGQIAELQLNQNEAAIACGVLIKSIAFMMNNGVNKEEIHRDAEILTKIATSACNSDLRVEIVQNGWVH